MVRPEQVDVLYRATRGLCAVERDRLLAGATPEVRCEVEALLTTEAGDGVNALPELPPGACLGPYRIEATLGAGAMGVVYRARDTRLGRPVAIKIAKNQLSARFAREARAISSLNHPNICTLFDVGPNYLVMELIEGQTLAVRLQHGPLSRASALAAARQILAALAHAHANGVIHRDLKPANILLTPSGLKLVDFGLAKLEQDETLTRDHCVIGTPAYMAPEQREGKPADARSDIYSFGCILSEMFTGARVSTSRRRVPEARIEAIVERCLQPDPARRPLLPALQAELDAVPVTRAARLYSRLPPRWITAALLLFACAPLIWWLRRAPAAPSGFAPRDTLVLADFVNRTSDPVFDGTLRLGLTVQLQQSPFFSLVSEQQIQHTLALMGKDANTVLTPAIAGEVCQRASADAVLNGAIAQLGGNYLLTLTAADCSSGQTLASSASQANDKSHVLAALGQTAATIRKKLGESRSTVAHFDTPLEQATTSSLDALKAFTSALSAPTPQAIELYRQAIRLDPDFALAYAWLGIAHTVAGEPATAAGFARHAYDLRDHVSQPERYFIEALYEKQVTGNLERAEQILLLWSRVYPRVAMPHGYLAGGIYPPLGRHAEAAEQARLALQLQPDAAPYYAFLMESEMALGHRDAAQQVWREAQRRKLGDVAFLTGDAYLLAWLRNDAQAMQQAHALAASQPLAFATVLAYEADSAAYAGKLSAAALLSTQAIAAVQRAGSQELAASFAATAALRQALFGYPAAARQQIPPPLRVSANLEVLYASALALTYAGDTAAAEAITFRLSRRFPQASIVQEAYLPTLRARLALNRHRAAFQFLQPGSTLDLARTSYSGYFWSSLYPVYVRGEAYLAAHDFQNAAAQFQRVVDHPGLVWSSPIGALARLQLARAYAQGGDIPKAHAGYQDFLALWKNADPDLPILQQARRESAALPPQRSAAAASPSR